MKDIQRNSIVYLYAKQGSEKTKLESQIVPWTSSSHNMLTRSHFLIFLVNDFVRE